MTRYFIIILLFGLLDSCNTNPVNGKIELRKDEEYCSNNKSKSVYLVNKSIDKTFEFTIKKTEITNEASTSYETFKEKLAPGDEMRLGCDSWFDVPKYHKKTEYLILPKDYYIPSFKIDSLDEVGNKELLDYLTKLAKENVSDEQMRFARDVFSLNYNTKKQKNKSVTTDSSLYYIFEASNGTLLLTKSINEKVIINKINDESIGLRLITFPKLFDTIVNNQQRKYLQNITTLDDSTRPIKRNSSKIIYECTGQRLIKNEK